MSTAVNNNNNNNSSGGGSNKTAAFSLNEVNVCADCGQTDPTWASINHGVLIKSLKATNWRPSQLQMVVDLHRTGANSIWEHTLLDPHLLLLKGFPNSSSSSSPSSSSSSSNHHHNHHRNHQQQKKPQPGDPLHPTKSDFIRANQNAGSKGATVDEDAESEADFSEQLHSSVRTPNLKTSLRLLVAGANPNYIHSEKFNSPLHMAAKSGQSSQIELLLVYGANLAALDARGKTAIDYAREAGHLELVHRLIEHQFDLTDSLTRYLCLGRTPNHLAGEHFLVVDIRPECLNSSDVSASFEGQDPKAANAAFRAELHASLQSLSASSFQELTRDIYDEIDRREVNAFVAGHYGKGKEKTQLEKAHQQLLLPFLPVYQCFSSTRNQGRQKLALLNTKEFTLLIVDVLNEIRHRVYGFASASVGSLKGMMEGYTNVTGKTVTTDETFDEDNDSEPLYDSVPSEGDYDECNEIVVPRGGVQRQQNSQPNQDQNLRASSTTLITNSSKSADSQQNACYVSQNEYALLKEQMLRSATLMEQFVAENREMRGEMARLQATVERLVEENAQLKGLQLLQQQQQQQTMMMVNQNSQSYLHQNSSSSTSLNFLEHQQQQQQLKSNSMHFDDPALQQQLQLQRNSFLRASGSRVRPQSTATTNSFQGGGGGVVNNASSSSANSISGGTQNQQQQQQPMVNRYSNECISSSSLNHKTTPPMLSSNQSSNSSLLNYQIQAQQQQQQQSFPAPPPPFPLSNQSQSLSSSSNPNQQQQQFSAHSSSSSLSSPSQIPTLQQQQHQNQQQQQQQQSLPYLGSVAAAVEQLNAAHHQQLQFNSGGNNNVSSNVVIATSTGSLSQLPPTTAINTTTTASSFPSKEDVIKKIEFITNSIKELLSNAREGKHDEFSVCSERICNYVDEMISLFPESFGSGKTAENVLQVNQALMVLQENAIRLHEECNSYELNALLGIVPKPLPSGKNSLQNSSQDYRFIYNSVIDKAAEVASSVKVIVGHYSC
ncbi:glycerophosphoinositol permease [Tyrophagus putrescentiae]|nr:glycerophosphoinositol permease [Tyrophagus putrescentiae]